MLTERMPEVAAVVRVRDTNPLRLVENLLEMGLGFVAVVTDKSKDNGRTPEVLSSPPRERLRIIELDQGYSWVTALNTGISCIMLENEKRARRLKFILNISPEADLKPYQLDSMLRFLGASPFIGVVGTTFRGLKDGQEVSLGPTYNRFPRNTCALWRLEVFEEVGLFNAITDSFGGKEDACLIIWMNLMANFGFKMFDLRVDLEVGVHWDQEEKEKREKEALRKIADYYRQLVSFSPKLSRKLGLVLSQFGFIQL